VKRHLSNRKAITFRTRRRHDRFWQPGKGRDVDLDTQCISDRDPIQSHVEVSNVNSSRSKRSSSDAFEFLKPIQSGDGWKCSLRASRNKPKTWKTRSTSNFRKYLSSEHHAVYVRKDPSQSKLTHLGFSGTGVKCKYDAMNSVSVPDKNEAERRLTRFVFNHSQPFSLAESKDFIELCASLREEYDVPSRKTLSSRIIDIWSFTPGRSLAIN
jgi:hypothetical protein